MKINWTWLPYFSNSFASLVTQMGENVPVSLVQIRFIWAARAGGEAVSQKSNRKTTFQRILDHIICSLLCRILLPDQLDAAILGSAVFGGVRGDRSQWPDTVCNQASRGDAMFVDQGIHHGFGPLLRERHV